MRRAAIAAAAALLLAALAVWRVEAVSTRILETRYPAPANPLAVAVVTSDAKEGARLAHLNGCTGCHGKDLTGGVMFSGIFGSRLVAPNLTRLVRHLSDPEIATAMRYGVKPDGTSLIGMPVGKFIRSSDSDVAATIAYLRTLPQKPDATPGTQWRFGGRFLLTIRMFLPETALVDTTRRGPRLTPTEPLALGAYIAQTQCSICHGADLSGDPNEHSPDLRVVIPDYTQARFQHFLATGEGGRKDHDTEIMQDIVKHRLHFLTSAETTALYAYLKVPASKAGSKD